MLKFKAVLFYSVCALLIVQVRTKAFLTRPIQTLSSSVFTASASADENSNIEDLRTSKSSKARQLSKYQDAEEDDNLASESTNEAVPNLFQKKIDKIMRKLQFVVQLVSRFYPSNSGNGGNKDPDFDSDFDSDEDEEASGADGNSTATEQFSISRYIEQNAQKKDAEKEVNNKARKSPENLGIHFMEVLGSLFGLIYGATIQLANNTNAAARPLL